MLPIVTGLIAWRWCRDRRAAAVRHQAADAADAADAAEAADGSDATVA